MGTLFEYNKENESYLYDINLELKNTKYAKLKQGLRGQIKQCEIKNNQHFLTIELEFNLADFQYKDYNIHDLSVIVKPLKLIVETGTWEGNFDIFLYEELPGLDTNQLYKDIIQELMVHSQFISYKVR